MEEERVIGPSIFDKPMHSPDDIGFGRLGHGVLLVVGQEDHVFPRIVEVAVEVCRHVLDIINAASKLTLLPKIIDADHQSLASACAVGVLEVVATWCAATEALATLGWWRRGIVISLDVGIVVHIWETCTCKEPILHSYCEGH